MDGIIAGLSSGTYTLPHGDLTRTFRLHLPPEYPGTVPSRLVMLLHGWGGNEDEFLGNRGVVDKARTRGYVLVAPRGLGSGTVDNSRNSWTFRGSATGLSGTDVNSKSAAAAAAICDTASSPDWRYLSCKTGTAKSTCSWTQCQDADVKFTVMPVMLITGLNDNVVPPGAWDSDAHTTTSIDSDRFYYTGATAITKNWAAAAGCSTSGKELAVA